MSPAPSGRSVLPSFLYPSPQEVIDGLAITVDQCLLLVFLCWLNTLSGLSHTVLVCDPSTHTMNVLSVDTHMWKAPESPRVRVLGSAEMEPCLLPHLNGLFHRGCERSCVTCHVWHGYDDRRWEAGKERGRMEKKGNLTTEWLLSDWVACLFL